MVLRNSALEIMAGRAVSAWKEEFKKATPLEFHEFRIIPIIEETFAHLSLKNREDFIRVLMGSLEDMKDKNYEDYEDIRLDRLNYHDTVLKELMKD